MTATVDPPTTATPGADRSAIARHIAAMLRDPKFDRRVRRFVFRTAAGTGPITREKKRELRSLVTKLRQTNFRRLAIGSVATTIINLNRGEYFWGPVPESLEDYAAQVLPRLEAMKPEHVKWIPSEVVCMLYPRTTAHMICSSLGYAPPGRAARIVWDGRLREENWCEWVYSCYRCDAHRCLRDAVQNPGWSPRRRRHSGYMSDYRQACVLVAREILGLDPPHGGLAAWF